MTQSTLHQRTTSPKVIRYLNYFYDEIRGYAEPHGVKIPFDRQLLTYTMRKVLSRWDYETDELNLALPYISSAKNVLDLGGGIGFISARLQQMNNDLHVTSFEANPAVASHYLKVMETNKLARFELMKGVLGDRAKSSSVKFNVPKEFWGGSLTRESENQKTVDVEVFDQVKFLEDHQFDLLMMDIEGGEYEVVDLMDKAYFKAIIAEIHDDILGDEKTERLLKKLEALGYTLLNPSPEGLHSVCVFEKR